jgi:AhpD family alkylhydroperoxidase
MATLESYALLEDDLKRIYLEFYKESYRDRGALSKKTKELIALGVALATGCHNCLEGHLRKARKHGASRREISETLAVALGVAAATIVDRSDIASYNLTRGEEHRAARLRRAV